MMNSRENSKLQQQKALLFKQVPVTSLFKLALLTLSVATGNLIVSVLIQIAINQAISQNFLYLISIFVSLIFANIVFCYSFYTLRIYGEKTKQIVAKELKAKVLEGYIELPYEEITEYNSSQFLSRVTEDCDSCSSYIINVFFPIVQMILSILLALVYVLIESWILGIALILIIPLFFFINRNTSKLIEERHSNYRKEQDSIQDILREIYENMPIVKVFKLSRKLDTKYERVQEIKQVAHYKLSLAESRMSYSIDTQIWTFQLLCILFSIFLVKIGEINYPALIGILNVVVGSIVWSLIDLPTILSERSTLQSSWERISQFLSNTCERQNIDVLDTRSYIKKIGANNISFKYKGNEKSILNNLSFEINAGEITYLLGRSGVGKSTLIDNVLQLLKPSEGKIMGYNLENKETPLIGKIEYMTQDTELFEISLKDNILLGKDKSIKEIENVLKKVNLLEFVYIQKKGLDGIVNVDIIPSPGEKQRILLARTLLSDKDILILDEPFSSLDSKSKKIIMHSLTDIKKDKMILVVSHDDSTFEIADKILVLDGGEYL